MEFTQRRIELVRARVISRVAFWIVPAAAAKVHDEQNGDEAKNNESCNDEVHGCAC
jgi:hypothetical protein